MKSVVFLCLLLGCLLAVEAGSKLGKRHQPLDVPVEVPVKAGNVLGILPYKSSLRKDPVGEGVSVSEPEPQGEGESGVEGVTVEHPEPKEEEEEEEPMQDVALSDRRGNILKADKILGRTLDLEPAPEAVQLIKDHIDACYEEQKNPFLCLSVDEMGTLLSHETILNDENPIAHWTEKEKALSSQIRKLKRGKNFKPSDTLSRIASMIASVILYNPEAATGLHLSWPEKQEEIRPRIVTAVKIYTERLGLESISSDLHFYVSLRVVSGFEAADLNALLRDTTFKSLAAQKGMFGVAAMGPDTEDSDSGIFVAVFD